MIVESPPSIHYSDSASAFCDLHISPVVDNRFLFQELRRFLHFILLYFTPMPQTFRYRVSVETDFPFGSYSVPSLRLTGILYKRRLHT